MSALMPRTIADLDVPTAELEARLRSGRLAEYGHLLHDADADSTVPVFPDLSKGRTDRQLAEDFTRSVRDGFVTPVEWGPAPVYPSRTADVQTGGAL